MRKAAFKMANTFAIVKKGSVEILVDAKHKNALIFENRPAASKYLRRVKSVKVKHQCEIVEVSVEVRRVR